MGTRSRLHGTVAAVAIVAVAVLGAGCSDDEPAARASTTTSSAPVSTTTTTMSDDEFTATVDGFSASVEQAGSDFCAVVEAATVQLSTVPANAAQVEQTVRMQTLVMEALAGTEPMDEANGATLRETAQRLAQAAEQAGHATGFMSSEEAADILMGEDFQQALDAYYQRAEAECEIPDAPAELGGGDAAP